VNCLSSRAQCAGETNGACNMRACKHVVASCCMLHASMSSFFSVIFLNGGDP